MKLSKKISISLIAAFTVICIGVIVYLSLLYGTVANDDMPETQAAPEPEAAPIVLLQDEKENILKANLVMFVDVVSLINIIDKNNDIQAISDKNHLIREFLTATGVSEFEKIDTLVKHAFFLRGAYLIVLEDGRLISDRPDLLETIMANQHYQSLLETRLLALVDSNTSTFNAITEAHLMQKNITLTSVKNLHYFESDFLPNPYDQDEARVQEECRFLLEESTTTKFTCFNDQMKELAFSPGFYPKLNVSSMQPGPNVDEKKVYLLPEGVLLGNGKSFFSLVNGDVSAVNSIGSVTRKIYDQAEQLNGARLSVKSSKGTWYHISSSAVIVKVTRSANELSALDNALAQMKELAKTSQSIIVESDKSVTFVPSGTNFKGMAQYFIEELPLTLISETLSLKHVAVFQNAVFGESLDNSLVVGDLASRNSGELKLLPSIDSALSYWKDLMKRNSGVKKEGVMNFYLSVGNNQWRSFGSSNMIVSLKTGEIASHPNANSWLYLIKRTGGSLQPLGDESKSMEVHYVPGVPIDSVATGAPSTSLYLFNDGLLDNGMWFGFDSQSVTLSKRMSGFVENAVKGSSSEYNAVTVFVKDKSGVWIAQSVREISKDFNPYFAMDKECELKIQASIESGTNIYVHNGVVFVDDLECPGFEGLLPMASVQEKAQTAYFDAEGSYLLELDNGNGRTYPAAPYFEDLNPVKLKVWKDNNVGESMNVDYVLIMNEVNVTKIETQSVVLVRPYLVDPYATQETLLNQCVMIVSDFKSNSLYGVLLGSKNPLWEGTVPKRFRSSRYPLTQVIVFNDAIVFLRGANSLYFVNGDKAISFNQKVAGPKVSFCLSSCNGNDLSSDNGNESVQYFKNARGDWIQPGKNVTVAMNLGISFLEAVKEDAELQKTLSERTIILDHEAPLKFIKSFATVAESVTFAKVYLWNDYVFTIMKNDKDRNKDQVKVIFGSVEKVIKDTDAWIKFFEQKSPYPIDNVKGVYVKQGTNWKTITSNSVHVIADPVLSHPLKSEWSLIFQSQGNSDSFTAVSLDGKIHETNFIPSLDNFGTLGTTYDVPTFYVFQDSIELSERLVSTDLKCAQSLYPQKVLWNGERGWGVAEYSKICKIESKLSDLLKRDKDLRSELLESKLIAFKKKMKMEWFENEIGMESIQTLDSTNEFDRVFLFKQYIVAVRERNLIFYFGNDYERSKTVKGLEDWSITSSNRESCKSVLIRGINGKWIQVNAKEALTDDVSLKHKDEQNWRFLFQEDGEDVLVSSSGKEIPLVPGLIEIVEVNGDSEVSFYFNDGILKGNTWKGVAMDDAIKSKVIQRELLSGCLAGTIYEKSGNTWIPTKAKMCKRDLDPIVKSVAAQCKKIRGGINTGLIEYSEFQDYEHLIPFVNHGATYDVHTTFYVFRDSIQSSEPLVSTDLTCAQSLYPKKVLWNGEHGWGVAEYSKICKIESKLSDLLKRDKDLRSKLFKSKLLAVKKEMKMEWFENEIGMENIQTLDITNEFDRVFLFKQYIVAVLEHNLILYFGNDYERSITVEGLEDWSIRSSYRESCQSVLIRGINGKWIKVYAKEALTDDVSLKHKDEQNWKFLFQEDGEDVLVSSSGKEIPLVPGLIEIVEVDGDSEVSFYFNDGILKGNTWKGVAMDDAIKSKVIERELSFGCVDGFGYRKSGNTWIPSKAKKCNRDLYPIVKSAAAKCKKIKEGIETGFIDYSEFVDYEHLIPNRIVNNYEYSIIYELKRNIYEYKGDTMVGLKKDGKGSLFEQNRKLSWTLTDIEYDYEPTDAAYCEPKEFLLKDAGGDFIKVKGSFKTFNGDGNELSTVDKALAHMKELAKTSQCIIVESDKSVTFVPSGINIKSLAQYFIEALLPHIISETLPFKHVAVFQNAVFGELLNNHLVVGDLATGNFDDLLFLPTTDSAFSYWKDLMNRNSGVKKEGFLKLYVAIERKVWRSFASSNMIVSLKTEEIASHPNANSMLYLIRRHGESLRPLGDESMSMEFHYVPGLPPFNSISIGALSSSLYLFKDGLLDSGKWFGYNSKSVTLPKRMSGFVESAIKGPDYSSIVFAKDKSGIWSGQSVRNINKNFTPYFAMDKDCELKIQASIQNGANIYVHNGVVFVDDMECPGFEGLLPMASVQEKAQTTYIDAKGNYFLSLGNGNGKTCTASGCEDLDLFKLKAWKDNNVGESKIADYVLIMHEAVVTKIETRSVVLVRPYVDDPFLAQETLLNESVMILSDFNRMYLFGVLPGNKRPLLKGSAPKVYRKDPLPPAQVIVFKDAVVFYRRTRSYYFVNGVETISFNQTVAGPRVSSCLRAGNANDLALFYKNERGNWMLPKKDVTVSMNLGISFLEAVKEDAKLQKTLSERTIILDNEASLQFIESFATVSEPLTFAKVYLWKDHVFTISKNQVMVILGSVEKVLDDAAAWMKVLKQKSPFPNAKVKGVYIKQGENFKRITSNTIHTLADEALEFDIISQ